MICQKKKCGWMMLCLILCISLLSGCGKNKKTVYHGDYIYLLDAGETKICSQHYSIPQLSLRHQISQTLHQLQQDPGDVSLQKPFPDDVQVEGFSIDKKGHLNLYLNAAYGNLTGTSEILRRAAIVRTLCQISDVKEIQFFVAGQPLTDSNMNTVGYMTAATFLDNSGGEITYRQKSIMNLYFATSDGSQLKEVPVTITYDGTTSLEQLAMEQLIKGPSVVKRSARKDIIPTVPKGTQVNKITIKYNTCFIDLNSRFLKKRKDITAEIAVYSVVNTLTEISNISKVQFSIDGEQVLLYNDTLDFGSAFERNLNLMQ
jgi:germination protein M